MYQTKPYITAGQLPLYAVAGGGKILGTRNFENFERTIRALRTAVGWTFWSAQKRTNFFATGGFSCA